MAHSAENSKEKSAALTPVEFSREPKASARAAPLRRRLLTKHHNPLVSAKMGLSRLPRFTSLLYPVTQKPYRPRFRLVAKKFANRS
jgi:hypothetical protein